MRQLTVEETEKASGAACGDLTVSVGLTGVSVSGSANNWGDCAGVFSTWVGDTYNSFSAHLSTGIPYGEAHIG